MLIDAIIFDLGGVLIDWNPEYLYRKIFTDAEQRKHFLTSICTPDWNEEQDAGRSLSEGTELLVSQYPGYEAAIRAFYSRWEEMLGGSIEGTVEILAQLKNNAKYRLYALTNWSAETFTIALQRYEFLSWFDGIVVSGVEHIRKPDQAFYQLLLNRYDVNPANALFIDDNERNIIAAEKLGISSILFTSAGQLQNALSSKGII